MFAKIGKKLPLKNGVFLTDNLRSPLFLYTFVLSKRKGGSLKGGELQDRLSQLWDSLKTKIISCIMGPYQLYKIRY